MSKPRLLDLFCGAGGAAKGYADAGFEVMGVDRQRQPRYPFHYLVEDVFDLDADWLRTFDVIHASPPCQAYSTTRALHTELYPALIGETRDLLWTVGVPFVIENVQGAPLDPALKLCGSSFGLGVRRHRWFESSLLLFGADCRHDLQPEPIDVTGTGSRRIGPRMDGKGGNSRKPRNLAEARKAMGIGWMQREELSEAVPPAFTRYLGSQLRDHMTPGVKRLVHRLDSGLTSTKRRA